MYTNKTKQFLLRFHRAAHVEQLGAIWRPHFVVVANNGVLLEDLVQRGLLDAALLVESGHAWPLSTIYFMEAAASMK